MSKQAEKETLRAGIMYRAAEIGDINEESRTVSLSFSSEAPVDRFFGAEVLDHAPESVRLEWLASGRAPLLADHDPEKQIGVIENAEIASGRVGRAVVRFGKGALADSYFQDVKDGIRGNVSVGYRIHQAVIEEKGGKEIYRVTQWEPLEVSLVSVPADQSVGVGRSQSAEQEIILTRNHLREPKTMKEHANQPTDAVNAAPASFNADAERETVRSGEVNRIREIQALGARHGLSDKADAFIAEGKSLDAFRSLVLDHLGKAAPIDAARGSEIGLTDKEAKSYSFVRAIRAVAMPDNKEAYEAAAFEREVSDAVNSQMKRKFQGNLQIPTEVLMAARSEFVKRDLNVANAAQGGYTVDTDLLSGSFIDLLRNRMLVKKLGATVLTGLEGKVAIPKQTGGASVTWLDEGEAASESNQGFGQVTMDPKTASANTELTRRLLLQSSIDIEMFVRNDLAKAIALGIDAAALTGSGASGEPLGIVNTTGIGSVTITSGTYTYGKIVDLETQVAADNADFGKLAYLTSATDRGIMKQTEKASGTAQFLWNNMAGQPGVGELNGYAAYATNQLTANTTIFGNWEDLVIGEWGVLDLIINPYAKDTSGGVRVTALQDVDTAVRHPESFAKTAV